MNGLTRHSTGLLKLFFPKCKYKNIYLIQKIMFGYIMSIHFKILRRSINDLTEHHVQSLIYSTERHKLMHKNVTKAKVFRY